MAYAASDVLHLHALRDKLDAMLAREGRTELAAPASASCPTGCGSISPAGGPRTSSPMARAAVNPAPLSPAWGLPG